DAELRLREAASKKILIEVAILKAIEARRAVSIEAVLQQLQSLRGSSEAAPSAPRATPAQKPSASTAKPSRVSMAATEPEVAAELQPAIVQQPQAPAVPVSSGGSNLAGLWDALLESVGRVSPFTRSYLLEAHPVSFEKNLLTIGFDPEFEDHIGLVD